ncbi:tetratricopeptide repeat protein [Flavobacterium sp. DG1-102-2]|uniref:tetratricopeptide repeat protein n=1 Tax=Flavobacterium sp. DG1-102-2 TaxID=3081663 RepID=UPI00294905B2|nr:tetratricopeptide repeat protein [Flavobacterium sp. DG1-102-2]MDV6167540.1 tetratricopeptide repeat protein [Flavobacterium sp. DG1-102-2]
MVRKLHLTLFFVAALSFGQEKNYDFKAAEINARKLLNSNPDKALAIIKKTLTQPDVHDSVYGKTYNLYGIYYGMAGKPDSTIFYTKKSLTYLIDYPALRVKSLMNLAIGYRNKGAYGTSIKLLNEAIAIQKKLKNNAGLATAYGEQASNYSNITDYNKAVDYLLKAIPLFHPQKNRKDLYIVKQKLAGTYLVKENYAFAIDLYRECLPEFKKAGLLQNYYLTLINLGDALTHTSQYDDAAKTLDEAKAGLITYGDKELIGICIFKIAELEAKQGRKAIAIATYDNALISLREAGSVKIIGISGTYIDFLNRQNEHQKALSVISTIEAGKKFRDANRQDQLAYQNAIAETYKATHNDKEAIKAYQNTIVIMDSIAAAHKNVAVEEIQAKFQTQLQREKNLALEANNRILQNEMKIEKRLIYLYIFISFAIIVLISLFLRGYWLKNKLQKEELKAIEAEKILIQQQHEYEQGLTNSQKEIIEEKQRELTSTALRMANYQDNITTIIEKCNSNNSLNINDIKKELQLLMKQKDYWKQFETRFNALHPEFGTVLNSKFPKLTKNDIEFCSLLKLNLSNKEIASLLQISHESAITKKYRIKKKMEINDDAEFEKLLMEI